MYQVREGICRVLIQWTFSQKLKFDVIVPRGRIGGVYKWMEWVPVYLLTGINDKDTDEEASENSHVMEVDEEDM